LARGREVARAFVNTENNYVVGILILRQQILAGGIDLEAARNLALSKNVVNFG
jgi:hypothetical protein